MGARTSTLRVMCCVLLRHQRADSKLELLGLESADTRVRERKLYDVMMKRR